MRVQLLVKRVGFDLVNCWHDFVMNDQIDEPVGLEITDTNGPNPAFFV
jgi:hypothetical protein